MLDALRKGAEVRRAISAIKSARPFADADVSATLGAIAPDVLARVAASGEAWWVRRAAVIALRGRVTADVEPALLEIVIDSKATEELRCAAIDLLAEAPPPALLSALQAVRDEVARAPSAPYQLGDVVESCLARLGDGDAFLPTLKLRYDAWTHRRERGDAAIRAAEEAYGKDVLARAFGAPDASMISLARLARRRIPEVRLWAMDAAPNDAPFILRMLADTDSRVAEGAQNALVSPSFTDDAGLASLACSEDESTLTRARAVLVLHRRGRTNEARAAWLALPERTVLLPEIPASVRRAILYHHLPGERGTDPRLVLEGELEHGFDLGLERDEGPDETFDAIHAAARTALTRAGIELSEPVPIGTVRQQGGGTYFEAVAGGQTLSLSTLGRFVRCEEAPSPRVRAALEATGFLFIDEALAATTFEGLCVYCFGRRDPLRVYDLLFYWQD